jgi:tripartite-type tricarboxylate transporter receptor subunit TctC
MAPLKTLLCALGLALALPALAQSVAEGYPSKPIHVIVPFPPGGTTEAMTRIIGDEMAKAWGQPVVIEMKPGASGNIGTLLAARAPADGYTLALGTQGTHGTNPILFKDTAFDPFKDFEPLAMLAAAPLLLVVNTNTPVKSVKELVSYIRQQPEGMAFASTSIGGGAHLAGEMFRKSTGLKLVHVPYKGSGPAKTDLMGGHVGMMFDNIASSLPAAQAGQLRALATTGEQRSAAAPDLPTMHEAGIDGVVIDTWYALYAPAGTPKEIVRKLNAEIVRVLQSPAVAKRFAALGLDVVGGTPEALAARMRSDVKRYAQVIKDAGITAE